LKEIAVKLKCKAQVIGGYAKSFCDAHDLKENKNDIEYLMNWI